MKFKGIVISGHYRRDGDDVLIELYCRGEDGRSCTVLYRDFRPYFHIVEPDDEVKNSLSSDHDVLDIDERILWTAGRNRNCLKVTIRFPFDVPKYRKKFQDRGCFINPGIDNSSIWVSNCFFLNNQLR